MDCDVQKAGPCSRREYTTRVWNVAYGLLGSDAGEWYGLQQGCGASSRIQSVHREVRRDRSYGTHAGGAQRARQGDTDAPEQGGGWPSRVRAAAGCAKKPQGQ